MKNHQIQPHFCYNYPMGSNADKDFVKFVLIVDDEEVNREMLGMILKTRYEVMYASDGVEALNTLRMFTDILSLVLLDINMPNKNGYEVLEEIVSDPALQKIPVVVLTSDKEAEIRSLKLGAADFLTKPYELPEVILARLDHSIALYENADLIHATENDSLTGLYNREFFFKYCDRYTKHHPDTVMDAIVLNINRFHLINALNGRHYGDKVLCAVSNRLRHTVMVLGGMACRYDADSFYLYIPHTDDYDELFRSVVIGLNEVMADGESRLRMGIYSEASTDNDIAENFGWALQACNMLRNKPGSRYAFFDEDMHQRRIREAALIADFDRAMEAGQFTVYYQPKFAIHGDTPALCSAEALVRWNHPLLGLVDPAEFVTLFEENGLIHKLDMYVWTEVGNQIRKWHDMFGVYLPVSVNVSRMDLFDPEITSVLYDIVTSNEIPFSKYLLEITESVYSDNFEQLVFVINRLRDLGFRVEMDDFGTGYSSLNMLYSLPVDVLKVDKEFLRDLTNDKRAVKMVEFVIDIAKFLGMPVVAEGVDEHSEYELLKSLGCDIIQGYYMYKPMPASEMTGLIGDRKNDLG